MTDRFIPLAAAIAVAMTATSAQAHDPDKKPDQRQMQQKQMNTAQADVRSVTKDLSDMRTDTVRATDILRGDITNGLNAMGTVQDLVLNDDASRVEYVIFNTGIPWTISPGPGYLPFNQVALEKGATFYGVDVRTDIEGDVRGPEELRITEREADYRLASHITDERISFGDGEEYEIEDILIKPESGEVEYFVIGTDPDGLFSTERRAVPADRITVRNGSLTTDLAFNELDEDQPYAIYLLW